MSAPPSTIFGSTIISPRDSPVDGFQNYETFSPNYLREKNAEENNFIQSKYEESHNSRESSESENREERNTQKIIINRDLLIYKAFYFLFYGAVGSLFPYLVVFYKQLYLSAQQVGFLIGIRPFIQMCTVPLWGALADTYNVKKFILLLAIGCWLATNFSLVIVRIPPETACNITSGMVGIIQFPQLGKLIEPNKKMIRNFTMSEVMLGKLKKNKTQLLDKDNMSNLTSNLNSKMKQNIVKAKRSIDKLTAEDNQDKIIATVTKSRLGENAAIVEESPDELVLFTMTRIKKRREKRGVELNDEIQTNGKQNENDIVNDFLSIIQSKKTDESKRQTRSIYSLNEHHNTLWKSSPNKTSVVDHREPVQRLLIADEIEEEFDSLNTDDEYPWALDNMEVEKLDKNYKNTLNTFVVLIIITVLGTIFASPAATLADTATLEKLGDASHQYGYQRLWGAFGWGLCAFVVGAAVSSIQLKECLEGRHVDYILSFYVYAGMMALAFLCAAFFKFNPVERDSDYTESLWETVKIFSDCQHIVFVLTLLLTGASMGFVHTFLFWHLHDLGGTQFLFSVISGVQCVSEVLMYLLSSYLLQKIGYDNVLYIGLSANVIRLFAYSFLTQPVYSIILEILQGISSASIWSAAICYIGLIQGTPVTLQAFLHAVYWGLGHGGGGILGGVLVTYFGSKVTFTAYGIIGLTNLLILAGLKYWSKVLYILCNYTYVENIQAGTYILTSMSQRAQTDEELQRQN